MFEVKRKPNSPGGRAAAAPRAFQDTGARMPTGEPQALQNLAVQSSPRLRTSPPIVAPPLSDTKGYQTKLPVITGEAQYKGMLNVDGTASGQLGGSGGSLTVRQRSRSFFSEPEFSGEVSFRDAIRVNGHIAGTVYSKKGTLIVDVSATVNAHVDVAVAVINGTVKGDVIAHQRVEIGPNARIYGNIYTRSIEIKNGAIFEGVCTMMAEEQIVG
ncbi:MAG: bactofilin family protein [Pyrinomonadaceae bacterium]